jgi:hypothetical protein
MLPKQLKYGSKIESAPAKSSRLNVAPQNGTGPYNLGDTIIINIPTRSNLVLAPSESYLRFNLCSLNAAAATAVRLDSCGAHGFIQRIRIFHGSNLLQDIDNYGLLVKMMFDLQVPTDATYGKFNVLAGTRSDLVIGGSNIITADAADLSTAQVLVNKLKTILNSFSVGAIQINSGELIYSGATPTVAANGNTNVYTFCLNLLSLIGTLCPNNYFPLFACTSSPLRVEITLVDSFYKAFNTVTAVTAIAGSGFITNVEYIANMIELGDVSMGMIQSSLGDAPLQFVYNDFRNYQFAYALPNGTQTQVQMPITAKFCSLKSIFVAIRDKGSAGGLTFFPYSSVNCGLTDYQFRVGATIMPPKSVSTYQEMFAECVKAIGSMSDLNYQPSIDKNSYMLQTSGALSVPSETGGSSGVSSGSFYIGLDLENYVSAPKDSIFAGYKSNTDDIYAIMNFTAPAAINARFDAYACFDCLILFEHGTCWVQY